jgi:glutamate synthase (ferredoxin)
MSGGIAYVLDERGEFEPNCNKEMVQLSSLADPDEIEMIHGMVQRHAQYTGSQQGWRVLALWDEMVPKFVKVLPNDYKRVLEAQQRMKAAGMSEEEAAMAAFEENAHDLARVGGR